VNDNKSTDTQLGRKRSPAVIAVSDKLFYVIMAVVGGTYVVMILLLIAADVAYMLQNSFQTDSGGPVSWATILVHNPIIEALNKPEIRYSIILSMISCTISAVLSLFAAVPISYLLARYKFPGCNLIDAILDIPIVLPPLVIGLSLLIFFQFWPLVARFETLLPFDTSWGTESLNSLVVYQVPSVILAQFMVAAAFAVRTMRATFDQIDPRCEQVALTLGSSRVQAFGRVVLPEARRGMFTAATLAWARSLGEFGPLLIFAGATRNKTEVLSTTVFLELSIGDLEAAVAVSLIMIAAAVSVLVITRMWGSRQLSI
jgi:molybdate transport system permease protein